MRECGRFTVRILLQLERKLMASGDHRGLRANTCLLHHKKPTKKSWPFFFTPCQMKVSVPSSPSTPPHTHTHLYTLVSPLEPGGSSGRLLDGAGSICQASFPFGMCTVTGQFHPMLMPPQSALTVLSVTLSLAYASSSYLFLPRHRKYAGGEL